MIWSFRFIVIILLVFWAVLFVFPCGFLWILKAHIGTGVKQQCSYLIFLYKHLLNNTSFRNMIKTCTELLSCILEREKKKDRKVAGEGPHTAQKLNSCMALHQVCAHYSWWGHMENKQC